MEEMVRIVVDASKYVLPFLSLWILIRCVRSMLREKYEPEIWGYILDGRNKTTYPLTHWENMLGRTRNADVHLTNRSVQRVHGVLIRDDNGKWKIFDTFSRGRIAVNGKQVQPDGSPIKSGDSLAIGNEPLEMWDPD